MRSSRSRLFVASHSVSCGLFNLSFSYIRHVSPCGYLIVQLLAPCCSLQFELFLVPLIFLFIFFPPALPGYVPFPVMYFSFFYAAVFFSWVAPPVPSGIKIIRKKKMRGPTCCRGRERRGRASAPSRRHGAAGGQGHRSYSQLVPTCPCARFSTEVRWNAVFQRTT